MPHADESLTPLEPGSHNAHAVRCCCAIVTRRLSGLHNLVTGRVLMRRWLKVLCTLLAIWAVPTSGWAQRTTGDIRGVITDESAAVLPGVTVTLKGRTVAGTPTVVTNESGVYRFPNLPPGSYDLSAELQGFATSNQQGVIVALGATTELNVMLKVSAQSETVTVTALSPIVDATTTQVATNYSREWVANAPVRRFTFF